MPGEHLIPENEVDLAREMLRLRLELAKILQGVMACSSCAKGHPPPNGIFAGGYCCGSATENLFTEDELAALRASGSQARHLQSRARIPAGCAFRDARGCSLSARHRPNTCTSYLCEELCRELKTRGDLERAEALSEQLKALLQRFSALRRTRELDALVFPKNRWEK